MLSTDQLLMQLQVLLSGILFEPVPNILHYKNLEVTNKVQQFGKIDGRKGCFEFFKAIQLTITII